VSHGNDHCGSPTRNVFLIIPQDFFLPLGNLLSITDGKHKLIGFGFYDSHDDSIFQKIKSEKEEANALR
jgi:hypothetical protein